jgi:hypothetical protein
MLSLETIRQTPKTGCERRLDVVLVRGARLISKGVKPGYAHMRAQAAAAVVG